MMQKIFTKLHGISPTGDIKSRLGR